MSKIWNLHKRKWIWWRHQQEAERSLKKEEFCVCCCFLNVTIPKIATFFMSSYKLWIFHQHMSIRPTVTNSPFSSHTLSSSWRLFPNGVYVCRLTTRFPTSMHDPQGCSFNASFSLFFSSTRRWRRRIELNFFALLLFAHFLYKYMRRDLQSIICERERVSVRGRHGSERGKVLA